MPYASLMRCALRCSYPGAWTSAHSISFKNLQERIARIRTSTLAQLIDRLLDRSSPVLPHVFFPTHFIHRGILLVPIQRTARKRKCE